MRPFRSALGAALGALLLGPATAGTVGAETDPDVREEIGARLQVAALDAGALSTRYDEDGQGFVVTVGPGDDTSRILAAASRLGASVRVVRAAVDANLVDQISDELEALRPQIRQSYGFGFDAESGTIRLMSEAPEEAFRAVTSRYPGAISFRPGYFRTTTMGNDPTAGGASIVAGNQCTSGFSFDFNSGGRYMVTAGHCFSNGTQTNMGTAWNDPQVYPYYDFELIYGGTYYGRIYHSWSNWRPVYNAYNPSIGAQYCTTGYSSGVICTWIVRSLNVTICYTENYPGCAHELAGFNKSGGGHVVGGDSGGPLWYSYSSPSRAGVRGVISGYFWDIFTADWMSYATQYQTISSFYVGHATWG